METTSHPTRPTWEHRLQAVLALLGGEPVLHGPPASGWASILYKWRHRAHGPPGALTDHRPGPQCPANRLSPAQEQPLVELAQRHPTWRRRSMPRLARKRHHPAPSNACATAMSCRACPNGRPPAGPPGASRGM